MNTHPSSVKNVALCSTTGSLNVKIYCLRSDDSLYSNIVPAVVFLKDYLAPILWALPKELKKKITTKKRDCDKKKTCIFAAKNRSILLEDL